MYEEERGDWKQLEACRDKNLSHLFFSKMIRNIEDSSVVNSSCRGYIWLEEVWFFTKNIWATEVFLSYPKPQVILTIFTNTWSCFNIECYGCLKGIEQIRLILNILTIELLLLFKNTTWYFNVFLLCLLHLFNLFNLRHAA